MGTASALLLTLCVAAGEPLSADELQLAVAALEQAHSRLQSFEVTYQRREEAAPGVKTPRAPSEFLIEWSWRLGREHQLSTQEQYRDEWWYDGNNAYVWLYKREDPPKLAGVWIYHWRPAEQAVNYDLALVTGFGGLHFDGGVLALVKKAEQNRTLSGERTERGWELALGKHDVNRLAYDITLVLDPQHDYRLASWQIESENTPPDVHRFIVDEFQSVTDEADGSAIWYPLRAHTETALQVVWLQIDAVRINLDLPDDRFSPPEMPFGTEVNEVTVPGQIPKRYLVGGEDAEEQRLSALAAMARKERDRLEAEGVLYDGTPNDRSRGPAWIAAGALLLLIAGFLHWRRRRAA